MLCMGVYHIPQRDCDVTIMYFAQYFYIFIRIFNIYVGIFQTDKKEEVISIDSSSNSDRLQIDDESNNSEESDKVRGKSAEREIVPTPIIEGNKDVDNGANKVDAKSQILKESVSSPAVQEIVAQNVNEVLNPTVSVQVTKGKGLSAGQKSESNVLKGTKEISTIQVENKDQDHSTKVQETTDPLNLEQVSLMTDDNSVHSDLSTMLYSENVEKSEEKVDAHKDKIVSLETGKS